MSDEIVTQMEGWRENVAKSLIAERDEADARYLREHMRATFMASTLDKIEEALPDLAGRSYTPEQLLERMERISDAIGRYTNASGGDDSWWERQYDFDEWERDYFGPRPIRGSSGE